MLIVFLVFLKWVLDGIQIFFNDDTITATRLEFQGSSFIFVQLYILILIVCNCTLICIKFLEVKFGITLYVISTAIFYTSIVGAELLLHLAINNYLITTQYINFLITSILLYLGVFLRVIVFFSLFFIKRFETLSLTMLAITRGVFSLHLLTVYYLSWYYIWEIGITLTIWNTIAIWFSTLLLYILILALILYIIKKIISIFK